MSRVKWKGPYLNSKYFKANNNDKNLKKKQNPNLIISRNFEIIPKLIGKTFKIYNGKKYIELTVTEEMINHKFGEFAFTRGRFSFKKKKSKK